MRPTALGLVLLSLASPACYASHERGAAADAGARRDAGVERDSGPPSRLDAGDLRSCRPVEIDTACVDTDSRPFLSSREPTQLLLHTDDCHCAGELGCVATVEDGEIQLTVLLCEEAPCRACTEPVEVRCEIPPVSEGQHTIRVNDARQFELYAMPSAGAPPSTLCQHVGSSGGGLCDFPGRFDAWRPDRVCFRDQLMPGSLDIVFEKDDTSCALEPGPCDVYAGEAPDGSMGLEIRPRVRSCDEGASTWGCIGMSGTLRRTCRFWDLSASGTYRLHLQDGTPLGEIEVGSGLFGEERCRSVP